MNPFSLRYSVVALVALVVSAVLPAQTFVVDAAGSGNFTSIGTATATVPSGSTLLVRAGSYAPFGVTGKSLRILCDPGVEAFSQFSTGFVISGLTAGHSVIVQGLALRTHWGGQSKITCTSCAGSVLVDRVTVTSGQGGVIEATDCAQLLLRDLLPQNAWRTCTLTNCHAVFERISLTPGWVGTALTMTGGTLQAADTTFQGGTLFPSMPTTGFGALTLAQGAEVRLLTGCAVGVIGTATPAVHGLGTARHDPSVVLNGLVDPVINVVNAPMPAVTSSYAAGVATARLHVSPGQLAALFVALPGPRITLPGTLDPIWLDSGSLFPAALGVAAAGTPLQVQLPWSGGPVAGVRAVWQGVTLDAGGTLQLSNPSLTLLP